jgi:phosphatidate cytidylyltransferase
MLKQRVAVAAIGLLVIIPVVWFGDPWFSLFIAIAALIATFEFYRLVTNSGKGHPLIYFGLLWALALVLSPHYQNFSVLLNVDVLPLAMTLPIVISLIWLLRRSPQEEAFRSWAWTVAGVLYVGWMLSYWLNLRILEDVGNWVYLALFTTFANDTGAFFVGRAWGKHPLVSAISPGKTWEGALGGLLSAIAAAVIVFIILNLFSPFPLRYWQVILLGFLVSLSAQFGDLVESLLKRNMGVKESGKLLPGHGGALDRLDSLIFVGAVVYYYVIWVVA